jgi:KTSC domain
MSNKHEFTNSSSLTHVDYFEDKNTMEIKFASGAVYHYPDCHPSHYEGLKGAESPGKYFHTVIRNKLTGTKISD